MSNTTVAEDPLSLHSAMRSFIADAITPISAFLALAQPGRSCLLESVEGTDRISRYSFIGIDYLEAAVFDDDPQMLARIRSMIGKYGLDTSALPFPGGAVCVFTYDAARQFERIGPKPASDIPFSDALVVVPGTWVVFDHFTHRVTLIGFARHEAERSGVEARLAEYERRLLTARASVPNEIRVRGEVVQSMDRPTFLERVATAKHHIYEGDIYQIQVGIRFSAEIEGGSAFDFYRQIRTRNPSPYMFYIEHGGEAVFGASPEFLVRLDGRKAQMRPLAGTRSRGADPAEDAAVASELLANEKERAEHVMLVDLGRNDLGAVATTGSVHVDELMIIERFSHVMHIVSNVVAELRPDRDALDLFAATFPAGTVTGAPKIRAMQLIDSLEPVARNFYAGSIAHFHFDGDMDSCITLRCVAVAAGKAYWQASAGIVADSDPAAEYAEIQHKTGIVRAVLGLPGMKLLLVDNYDSFTYNLAHLFGSAGAEVDVIRNDDARLADGVLAKYDATVVGPGPGRPEDAGRLTAIVNEAAATEHPLLGVCLGAQGIGAVFGGEVIHAPHLMHGKTSEITHDGSGVFAGLPSPFTATRYHSLCVSHVNFPSHLRANATSEDGVIQGIAHRTLPIWGVQFHPESILTPAGKQLAHNFLTRANG